MSIQFENLNFTSRDSLAAFLRLSTDKLYNIMSLCELDAKTIYNVCQIFVVVGHPKIHCYRAADGAAIKLSESETIFHSKRQLCSYHLKYLGNQSRMESGDIIVETFTLCLIIFRTNKPPFFPLTVLAFLDHLHATREKHFAAAFISCFVIGVKYTERVSNLHS